MIMGIGIDMIETARIKAKLEGRIGFREYLFSGSEITYCEERTNKAEHYAARFAAKEALLKALGTGVTSNIALNEVAVNSDEKGKPYFIFSGITADFIASKKFTSIHLTMSHLKDIACAMVVIEKN